MPCRETAAGRALFNIYDGADKAKRYDKHTRARNADAVGRASAPPSTQASTATIPASKAHVPVPKFGNKQTEAASTQGQERPQRRQKDVIEEEMAAAAETAAWQRQPLPTGPLLDAREKERCAALMEHRGKLPELSDKQMAELNCRRRARPKQSRCGPQAATAASSRVGAAQQWRVMSHND